jgi:hypothetical protein
VTRDEKEQLASALLDLYADAGFGSPSKREVDLLIFHHVTQARENRGKTNYQLASVLKIPESRVKTFRLASALKYQNINSKAILGNIVLRLSRAQQFSNIENGKIEISLEDPVEKRELENFLKSKGHFAEYTFNAEVLRIAPIRLLELIVENMESGERQFNELVRQHIQDQAASERILEGAPTLKQKFARLRKETMTASTLVSLLSGAAGAFGA